MNRLEVLNLAKEKGYNKSFNDLQEWLRTKHNIEVWAQPFTYVLTMSNHKSLDGSYSYFIFKNDEWVRDRVNFESFQSALNCGLYESLKLI